MLNKDYLNKIVKEPYCRTIFDISFISAFLSFFFKLLEKDILFDSFYTKILNNVFIIAPLIMGLTVSYVLHKDCKIYKKEEILIYCLSFLFLVLSYGLYREIGDSFLFASNKDIITFMFEKSYIYVTSLAFFYCFYIIFNYSYVKRNYYLFSKLFRRFYLSFETVLALAFLGIIFFRIFPSILNYSVSYFMPLFLFIMLSLIGFRRIILRKKLPSNYFKNIALICIVMEIGVIITSLIL